MASGTSVLCLLDVVCLRSKVLNKLATVSLKYSATRSYNTTSSSSVGSNSNPVEFGLFFDIDGVITRGRTLLPHSRSAFRLLTDDNGHFLVPSIFVTNSGNALRKTKAQQLSDWLGVQLKDEQVILSHSPLRMFRQFLDKHVLVCGQGPVENIASLLGYTKVTTMDKFRQCFPLLDAVDHQRRKAAPCAFEKFFPKIEAVLLLGDPVRWETNLQLIIDVLISNGRPSEVVTNIPYPHIPVFACNTDLVWMSEAPIPRLGHGCFLHCLESLYKKITGYELKYTALVGKPSEVTYHYAEHVLQREAARMKLPRLRRMYCIGDNPDTDIFGANLFNRNILKKRAKLLERKSAVATSGSDSDSYVLPHYSSVDDISIEQLGSTLTGIELCESVLVCTGVFKSDSCRAWLSNEGGMQTIPLQITGHSHRDFVMDAELCQPSLTTVRNVEEAIRSVFEKEGINQLLLQK